MKNIFERSGYSNPDGNLQFNPVSDQLRKLYISNISASQVLQRVVDYLVELRQLSFNDRNNFSDTFNCNRYSSYEGYINNMWQGDHLTLQAISEYFLV